MVSTFQSGHERWLVINEVPSCIQTYGGWTEEEIQSDTVVIVVSGNPGVSDFYVGFMKSLHSKIGGPPVWVIGHAGHEYHPDCPSMTKRPELFNMAGQVKHKYEFIQRFVPKDKKIILIGHSIGAKVCVELMKNESISSRVKQVHLMYPCLEHIGQTRNGRWFQSMGVRIFPVLAYIAGALTMAPQSVQYFILKLVSMLRFLTTSFEDDIVHGMMKMVRPAVVRQAVFFAEDEMIEVQELDNEVYEQHGRKIFAYYGQTDGWAPLTHYENLRRQHPNVNAVVMDRKYAHAFMVRNAVGMADEVSRNILNDEVEPSSNS